MRRRAGDYKTSQGGSQESRLFHLEKPPAPFFVLILMYKYRPLLTKLQRG